MGKKKILAADDSKTIRKAIEITFAKTDYLLDFAESGQVALEKIGSFQPDIVILDHRMPSPDGYELCKRIKDNPSTQNIQTVLLFSSKHPLDEGRAAVADARLVKPFDTQALLDLAEKLAEVPFIPADAAEPSPVGAESADDIPVGVSFDDEDEFDEIEIEIDEPEIELEPQPKPMEEATAPPSPPQAKPVAPPLEPQAKPAAPPSAPQAKPAAPPSAPQAKPAAPPSAPQAKPAAPPSAPQAKPAAPPWAPQAKPAAPPSAPQAKPAAPPSAPQAKPAAPPSAPQAKPAAPPSAPQAKPAAPPSAPQAKPAAPPSAPQAKPAAPPSGLHVSKDSNQPMAPKAPKAPSWGVSGVGAAEKVVRKGAGKPEQAKASEDEAGEKRASSAPLGAKGLGKPSLSPLTSKLSFKPKSSLAARLTGDKKVMSQEPKPASEEAASSSERKSDVQVSDVDSKAEDKEKLQEEKRVHVPGESAEVSHPSVEEATSQVTRRAVDATLEGIKKKGPEYEAIAKLSLEMIERIVWEVVPELAEVIIKENIEKLARSKKS